MKAFDRLLEAPARNPVAVLLVSGLATVLLAAGLTQLGIDTSIDAMIVEGDLDHAAFEAWKEVFGSDESVAVAIPFGDALAPESLAVQQRIVFALEELPEVSSVDSMVSTDDIYGRDKTLVVETLVPRDRDPRTLTASELAHVRERISNNPLWSGFLVSDDRKSAAIEINLHDPEATGEDRGALLSRIEAILDSELGPHPYYLAGHPFMKTEIARTMSRDFSLFLPVTMMVMAAFLALGVGSWRTAGVTFACIVTSVVWMLGAMAWVGQPITALSNAAPTILLALATAYFLHLAASYQKEQLSADPGQSAAETVRRALDRVRRPTFVAGITTVIGFGSLAISRVPLVRGFGVDLAMGVVAVVFLGCFTLPAALVLVRPGRGAGILAGGRSFGVPLDWLARTVEQHARLILVATVIAMAGAVTLARELEVDSSGPNAFAEDSRFRVASEFYRAELSGDVIENVFLSSDSEGFKAPERLRRILAFQEAAEALPEIDESRSVADYIALMNRALHENDPNEARIPDTQQAVAQMLLLYDSSGDPGAFDPLVDGDYARARIILKATVLSSSESAALRTKLEQLARRFFPEEAGPDAILSTEILLSQAADGLAREQVQSFALAIALILFVVALIFRSPRAGALLLVPNTLPIALNFGVMALVGIAISESTSVIAVITLGIAVDSSVHLLAAAERAEARRASLGDSIREALQNAGRPVVVASLIVVAGFSVLLLSDFKLIADLGGLTAATLAYCLVADLVVLPAQLVVFGGLGTRRTSDATDQEISSWQQGSESS